MNTKLIAQVEGKQVKEDLPAIRVGDSVRVGIRVADSKEGERIQYFEGVVISKSGSGLRQNITVRKIGANGVGVERILPVHAPVVASVAVVKQGKARRAKLYYLRDRVGKAALAVKSA